MEMFKGILVLISFLALMGAAFAALPEPTQLTYNPSPAIPGSTITVLVQVENRDLTAQTGVTLGLDENYPFTIKGESLKSLGNLDRYGKATAEFTVYVDPTAQNKTYFIRANVGVAGENTTKSIAFPIVVSGRQALLKVISVSTDRLIPGQEKEITLGIQNVGTSAAYDVMVELKEDRTVTATGAVVERDITPLGTATALIDQILPAQKGEATLKVSVNGSATLKNYTLPVTISYRGSDGTRTSETSYIGFKVSGNVDIDAAIKETTGYLIAGTKGEITVELFNKGNGKAEFTIIEASTDAGTLERPKQFIGALEPNDVDSFKAVINFKNDLATGPQMLTLKINYQDTDSTTKTALLQLPITVYSAAEGGALAGNGASPIILLVILAIVAFVGWKLYKKMKKK